ncbi:ATP-binding cassette domain-containing protein [Nocardioides sp. 616]|uniref:ABC transporter ATP-binding protein n=1 Tax=Nocardioides sp. 616 TaxID=2268090 RepID=UPI000CE47A08|nr:ATP-binding cassette domain-containing protein [Nocardioides sp. 616]
MLSGEGLWARHGRTRPWVLQDVSIAVAPGEVVGLWGASGRGKTTLAMVLAGFRAPDRGRVVLDGSPLPPTRGPRPVQLLLQHPERAMNPRWRVRDILAEARPDAPDAACKPDGLVDRAWLERRPHEISGGELQRVNLARALAADPAYLLADEISSSLDAITQAMLWRHLAERVHDQGVGVLAISHDRDLLARVVDRVVVLEDAAITAQNRAQRT